MQLFYPQRAISGVGNPWSSVDGSLNAPPGTPQFPNLLNTYHPGGIPDSRYAWPSTRSLNISTGNFIQPQWKVAGVDYAVGPRFTPLKVPGIDPDPSGTTTANGSFPQTMVVTGTDVSIVGWDFTQNGNWSVRVGTAGQTGAQGANVTITDNKFFGQSPIYFTVGGDGFHLSHGSNVIKYNVFDGGNTGSGGNPLLQLSHGDFTVQYNLLKQAWSDWIQAEGQEGVGTANLVVQFNLMMNSNMDNVDADVHGDWFQPAGSVFDSILWQYNCLVQNQIGTPGGAQSGATSGVGCGQSGQNPTINSFIIDSNTVITAKVSGFTTVTRTIEFGPTKCTSMVVSNNYWDTTGIGFIADFGPHMPSGYPAYIYNDGATGSGTFTCKTNNVAMSDVISLNDGTTVLTSAGAAMSVPT